MVPKKMGITEIRVFRPPCNFSSELVSAKVFVDKDLSELLPYVKGAVKEAKYFPKGPFIKFTFKGHPVTIEGNCIAVGAFPDDNEARNEANELMEFLQGIEARKETITPDTTPHKVPSVIEIYKLLPRKSGCGECGYQSCMAFATALVKEETLQERCTLLAENTVNSAKLREMLGC